jgi:hypothetical protein
MGEKICDFILIFFLTDELKLTSELVFVVDLIGREECRFSDLRVTLRFVSGNIRKFTATGVLLCGFKLKGLLFIFFEIIETFSLLSELVLNKADLVVKLDFIASMSSFAFFSFPSSGLY